jgi:hypothetical protein
VWRELFDDAHRVLVYRTSSTSLEPLTQEVLAGLLERVTFHNAESGFCVSWFANRRDIRAS